jgi:putative cardiolipin synthase
VDGTTAFVGSMNFDPRSISLNAEMGILFGHEDLIAEIRTIFAEETSPEASYRLRVEDGAIVWQDGPEGSGQALRREPNAGLWRRIAATIIGVLPMESQL